MGIICPADSPKRSSAAAISPVFLRSLYCRPITCALRDLPLSGLTKPATPQAAMWSRSSVRLRLRTSLSISIVCRIWARATCTRGEVSSGPSTTL